MREHLFTIAKLLVALQTSAYGLKINSDNSVAFFSLVWGLVSRTQVEPGFNKSPLHCKRIGEVWCRLKGSHKREKQKHITSPRLKTTKRESNKKCKFSYKLTFSSHALWYIAIGLLFSYFYMVLYTQILNHCPFWWFFGHLKQNLD